MNEALRYEPRGEMWRDLLEKRAREKLAKERGEINERVELLGGAEEMSDEELFWLIYRSREMEVNELLGYFPEMKYKLQAALAARERGKLSSTQRQTNTEEAWQRARAQKLEEKREKVRARKRVVAAVFLGAAIAVGGVVYMAQERAEEAKASIGIQEEIEQTQDKIEQRAFLSPTPANERAQVSTQETPVANNFPESSPTISSSNNFSESDSTVSPQPLPTEEIKLPDYSMLAADLQYSIETDANFLERAKEVMALIEQYDDWDRAEALAIAVAENRTLNPREQNTANDNGSTDSGLFQINSVHGYSAEELFNPAFNIEVAHKIWEEAGGSFSPWSTHNRGADKEFLNFYDYLQQME